jgi:hypothetical protein
VQAGARTRCYRRDRSSESNGSAER